MTPEDKANELIGKMEGGCCRCPIDAKEAALTCCDEIIEALNSIVHDDVWDSIEQEQSPTEYWQQVKQHIQFL